MNCPKELECVLEDTKDGYIRLSMGGVFVTYFYNVHITDEFNAYYIIDRNGNQITNFSKLFTKYIPFDKAVNDANE